MNRKRIAIFISGRGSNMAALLEAAKDPAYPASIALVLANRADAKGLETAADAGIDTAVVDHKAYEDRESFEDALHDVLIAADIDLICLAGFMRLLTRGFVDRWHNRMLNIHPSLLPSFKGLHTHERVLQAGAKITGATVHLVRAEMDDGPIIAQGAVAVRPDDTDDTLGARVLTVEHQIYPWALALIASGQARASGERIVYEGDGMERASLLGPALA